MMAHSRKVTETHALTGRDRIWVWIRNRDCADFTIREVRLANGLSRSHVTNFINGLCRCGILQRVEDGPADRWVDRPVARYRLAVDYGFETPRITESGDLRERSHNFDTPRAVWATLRIHECLGWHDLLANVNCGMRTSYSPETVRGYLRRVLIPGGYVIDTTPKVRTCRYLLVNDTGPRAPIWKKGAIWDANLSRRIDLKSGEVIDA